MVSLKENLCLNSILKALKAKGIDDYTLFRYYVKGFVAVGKPFKNRMEKFPSSNTKYVDGKILFKDFGSNSKPLTIFQYIMMQEGYPDTKQGFLASLDKVRQDFSLKGIDSYRGDFKIVKSIHTPVIFEQLNLKEYSSCKIECKTRNWEELDLEYWNQFQFNSEITPKLLKHFQIFPISYYWINGWQFKCNTLSYMYLINDKVKLYFPLLKENKWFCNTNKNSIQGWDQLPKQGKHLIITKSLKDVLCLYNELKINAISPNSETSFISKEKILELKLRFEKIIIYYDNDITGIESLIKFGEEFNLDYYYNPIESEYKDYSDVLKSKNISLIKQINKHLLWLQ